MDQVVFSENGVAARYKLETGQWLVLSAAEVRRERTGVHGKISVTIMADGASEGMPPTYDTFNVGRLPERVRLVNAFYKRLTPELTEALPQGRLQERIDEFCDGAWKAWLERDGQEIDVAGDPLSETEYVLRPWIAKGGGTFLFGPPGAGKSTMAQLFAVSVDAGISDLFPVEQTPVLIINLERSASSIARRIGHINTALGLEPQRTLAVLNRRGAGLLDVADQARQIVRQRGIGLIILDSISRASLGKLTEDQPANQAADTLSGICDTWLALGHVGRVAKDRIYGSPMYDAAGDVMVKMLTEHREHGMGLALEITKANDMSPQPVQVFALAFDTYGLSEVKKSSLAQWPVLAAGRTVDMAEAIKEYLRDVSQASAAQVAEATDYDRTNVSSFLSHDKQCVLIRKEGRTPIYGLKSPYLD